MSVARRPQVGDGIESIAKKGVKDVSIFCCAYYFSRYASVFSSSIRHDTVFSISDYLIMAVLVGAAALIQGGANGAALLALL